jgi:hypothetical protein
MQRLGRKSTVCPCLNDGFFDKYLYFKVIFFGYFYGLSLRQSLKAVTNPWFVTAFLFSASTPETPPAGCR